jgi:hypothetical protein
MLGTRKPFEGAKIGGIRRERRKRRTSGGARGYKERQEARVEARGERERRVQVAGIERDRDATG